MELCVIARNHSDNESNYAFVSPYDDIEDRSHICLVGRKKEIIVRVLCDPKIPKGSVMINPLTHGIVLMIYHGKRISYRKCYHLPTTTRIECHKLSTNEIIVDPNELVDHYVDVGYRMKVNQLSYVVTKGCGIFKPNISNADDIPNIEPLSLLLFDKISAEKQNMTINIDFKQFGIGGLHEQMDKLIRQVLVSRIIDTEIRNLYHVKDIKGILLHGPPGTGKTLIARNIANIIPNTVVKKINGPEMLSKWFGESESNIRNIFRDAQSDYQHKKDCASLHVIIFDEIDSIGRKRGGGEQVDRILTQILTMIDGLDTLPNILVIGITNRPDILDPALIRAGRLEAHIHVPLPNLYARKEILEIYFDPLRKEELLDRVKTDFWAEKTDGFSGADIESLVNRAKNLALVRNCDVSETQIKSKKLDKNQLSRVTESDLQIAFTEFDKIHHKYDQIVNTYANKFMMYNQVSHNILRAIECVDQSSPGFPIVIMIAGPAYTGKTALACKLAAELQATVVRYLGLNTTLGKSLAENIRLLDDIYYELSSYPSSVLIVDELYHFDLAIKIKKLATDPIDTKLIMILIGVEKCPYHLMLECDHLTNIDVQELNILTQKDVQGENLTIRDYMLR